VYVANVCFVSYTYYVAHCVYVHVYVYDCTCPTYDVRFPDFIRCWVHYLFGTVLDAGKSCWCAWNASLDTQFFYTRHSGYTTPFQNWVINFWSLGMRLPIVQVPMWCIPIWFFENRTCPISWWWLWSWPWHSANSWRCVFRPKPEDQRFASSNVGLDRYEDDRETRTRNKHVFFSPK